MLIYQFDNGLNAIEPQWRVSRSQANRHFYRSGVSSLAAGERPTSLAEMLWVLTRRASCGSLEVRIS